MHSLTGYVGNTAAELFGTSSAQLAAIDERDPGTPTHRTMASTEHRNEPPRNALRALLDPHGSAIFWVALASVLGLALVTGQVHVEAALGARRR